MKQRYEERLKEIMKELQTSDSLEETVSCAPSALLEGWDRQGLSDQELLDRGIQLAEGIYQSL